MKEKKGLINFLSFDDKETYKPIKKLHKPLEDNKQALEYMQNYLNYGITESELLNLITCMTIIDGSIKATPGELERAEETLYKIFYKGDINEK